MAFCIFESGPQEAFTSTDFNGFLGHFSIMYAPKCYGYFATGLS